MRLGPWLLMPLLPRTNFSFVFCVLLFFSSRSLRGGKRHRRRLFNPPQRRATLKVGENIIFHEKERQENIHESVKKGETKGGGSRPDVFFKHEKQFRGVWAEYISLDVRRRGVERQEQALPSDKHMWSMLDLFPGKRETSGSDPAAAQQFLLLEGQLKANLCCPE
jgi:hypothetical protein